MRVTNEKLLEAIERRDNHIVLPPDLRLSKGHMSQFPLVYGGVPSSVFVIARGYRDYMTIEIKDMIYGVLWSSIIQYEY